MRGGGNSGGDIFDKFWSKLGVETAVFLYPRLSKIGPIQCRNNAVIETGGYFCRQCDLHVHHTHVVVLPVKQDTERALN